MPVATLDLAEIQQTAEMIRPHVVETPSVRWTGVELPKMLDKGTQVFAKLELLQHSGTFKARGALSNILRLDESAKAAGVTAMSAGNHAIAVAYAASVCGVHAKVVMQQSANPARVSLAKSYGCEIVMAEDGPTGFAMAEQIAKNEGRAFIHPFDGIETALGTATLGLEMHHQLGGLDVLFIAVGGGGLAGGVSSAIRQLDPDCHMIGVEPEGADSMYRSFAKGSAQNIGVPATIADSLAPPMTLPVPFELCRANLDEVICVSDDSLRVAMRLIFRDMKMAVEPACAAGVAALCQRVGQLADKRVGVIFCGSNIDWASYQTLSQT